jgi:hypothetical protein
MAALKSHFVAFIERGHERDDAANVQYFCAAAEDVTHAYEQCQDAEPGCLIIGAWVAEGVVGDEPKPRRYSVLVTRDTTESAVITVEANDKADALEAALEIADTDPTVGWCRDEPGHGNDAYGIIENVDEAEDAS